MLSSRSRILAKVINKRWDSAGPKYDFLLNLTTPHSPTIKASSKNEDQEAAFPSSDVYNVRIQNQIRFYPNRTWIPSVGTFN